MKVLYMYPLHSNQVFRNALQIADEHGMDISGLEYNPAEQDRCVKKMLSALTEDAFDGVISQIDGQELRDRLSKVSPVPIVFAGIHLTVGNFSVLLNFITALRSNTGVDINRIVHIAEKASSIDADIIFATYGIRFSELIISNGAPAEEDWKNLRDEGCKCVLCPPEMFDKARQYGIMPFYLDTLLAYTSQRQAFRAMIDILTVNRLTLRQNRLMRQMVDYSFEAMMIVDRTGEIQFCNASAAKLFNLPDLTENRSVRLEKLLPDLTEPLLEQVFDRGEKLYGFRTVVNRQICTINMVPFEGGDAARSALLHCDIAKGAADETAMKTQDSVRRVAKYVFDDILGESEALLKAKNQAEQFAKYDSNVLLLGESGCGKELFAQSIHNASVRSQGPFVAINCGAISMSLLESELFGYAEGAFTGASRRGKKGAFEIADKGTIFLDEISTLEFSGQSRLLRVLEEHSIIRVGDTQHIPVDVRIIAASNEDLARLVQEGKFRKDLYYRLNVLTVAIPPVRNRGSDSVILMKSFLRRFSERYSKNVSLAPDCDDVIRAFRWDGNVRQIRNFAEKTVIIAADKQVDRAFICEQLSQTYQHAPAEAAQAPMPEDEALTQTDEIPPEHAPPRLEDHSRDNLIRALTIAKGNRKKAASILNVSYSTLWRKMKQYQIDERFT